MSLSEQLFGYGGGNPYDNNGQFPGLQFNPAPGTPQAVQHLVDDLDRAHRNLKSALEILNGIDSGDKWSGEAAEKFRAKTRSLPKMLDVATESFGLAHYTLNNWHSQLVYLQTKARTHESEARSARKRFERAEKNPSLQLFRDGGIGLKPDEVEQAQNSYRKAAAELTSARSHLEAIIADAEKVGTQHVELAGRAASALAKAAEHAPDKPGLFDDIKHAMKSVVDGIAKIGPEIAKWAIKHANSIAAIGDVFAAISTITGTVALAFPPSAVILAPASGITSGIALGLHLTARAAGGEQVVSDRTLAEDGLGVVSFGTMKAAARMEKLAEGAAAGRMLDGVSDSTGKISIGMTGWDWFKDQTGLGYFLPKSKTEAAVIGGSFFVAGPMGPPVLELSMAFKRAWNKGSEKDSAAQHQVAD